MRAWIIALTAIGCGLCVSPATLAQDNPKAIIERAVKAMGRSDKLPPAGASRRRVNIEFLSDGHKYIGESYSSKPDSIKLSLVPLSPNASARTMVMTGGKGWIKVDSTTYDLDDAMLARLNRARHADRVSGLTVILEKKGFALESLGDTKIKDKPAHGVKVKLKDQPDMHLYFDKKSGLLLKTWQKFTEAGTNQEMVHELYYSDYQTIDPAAAAVQLLKDAKQPVQGPALVKWLRKRTPKGELKNRIAKLIDDLGANAFRVRAKATVELKKIGVEAAPLLRAVLNSSDLEAVQRAQECLRHIEKDPTIAQIPAVVQLLALQHPKDATAALLDYLPWAPNDDIKHEVQAALFDLARLNGKPNPLLVRQLQSKDEARRAAAEAALNRDGGAYAKQPGRRVLLRGLKRAMRSEMYKNGKLAMRLRTLQVEYFNRLPDHIFTRPGPEL